MATIEVTRQHSMGLDKAKAAVETVARRLQADLNARYSWRGDKLEFSCPGADGCIDVTGACVRVAVDLGWLLRPMRSRVEQSIQQYLDESLS